MRTQRIPWQVREKHETDVRGLFERLDWLRNGRVVRFDGRVFITELFKMGHTASALEDCECRTAAAPYPGDTLDA